VRFEGNHAPFGANMANDFMRLEDWVDKLWKTNRFHAHPCERPHESWLNSRNGEVRYLCGNAQQCLLPLANEVGDALANHHRGDVGVGPNTVGHDGGVDNTQVLEAVHVAMLIHHGHGI